MLGWVPKLEGYRDVSLHPSAEVTPGVVLYRLDDRLFFANVALADLAREFRGEGVTLVVARLRSRMLSGFEVAGAVDEIGREHFYPSVRLAVVGFAAKGAAR